ncbi:MBL fold metallo-hydrolase [Candidatus Margulisiibacteriota bacterium]
MIITTITVGPLQTNCYLVSSSDTKETMVIDPGDEPAKIIDVIEKSGLKPLCIVNTHAHPDHLRGNADVAGRFNIPSYISERDFALFEEYKSYFHEEATYALKFDMLMKEGEVISVADLEFEVLETPGHSPGAVCLHGQGVLFSGDMLFAGDVGRTDIIGGSGRQVISSFKRLMKLPPKTKVYPGHGPSTTIKEERRSNILAKRK